MIKEKEINQEILSPLVAKIRSDFTKAKAYKTNNINSRLESCLNAFLSKYDGKKLAEIRQIGGSEIFVPLTNMKVRAGKAWLTDIFFQPNEMLFDIVPTPIPDLPDEIEAKIQQQIQMELQELVNSASNLYLQSQGQLDLSFMQESIKNYQENLKDEYLKQLRNRAKKLCERERDRIHDIFIEGGFYEAFSKCLHDITIYPVAILKGVTLRKQKKFITAAKTVIDVAAPTFNRVSPFDIFPSPSMVDFKDDYIIEVLHLTPQDLYSLIGVEGFNSEAILHVLKLYPDGYTENYVGRGEDSKQTDNTITNLIDIIEYWGSLKGELLAECELPIESSDAYYDVCIWMVNDILIKAIINPDPLGTKPYVKASFIEIPDSFWGIGLPEILEPIQVAVNSLARASINNSIISSGPLIERNIDRISSDAPKQIRPFEMFDVNESALNSAPAYRFYQLNPIAQQVILLMSEFQKMADEYSGIPAYAHGDITVGGAGRTASGLSMLTNNASRGIKEVIKNIDDGIIEPMVKMQYYFNLYHYIQDPTEIPDLTIHAKGSINLSEKQAITTRMLEFLQITSNPQDTQILGAEVRKHLLEIVAKNSGIDISEQLKLSLNPMNPLNSLAIKPMNPQQIALNEVTPLAQQAQELGQSVK